jgi:TPR repeat protein
MFRLVAVGRLLPVALLSLSAVAFVLLSTAQAQTDKGNRYALLVGVREYHHDSLPDLAHTENDVEELSEVLTASGYKVAVMTCTRGKKRAFAQPTAKNIRDLLGRILKRVTKHDTVLVALAGHGIQARVAVGGKEKEESFFCPTDARPRDTTDLKVLSETMISLAEVFKELEESGAGVKLLLVDACRNDPKLGRSLDVESVPRPPRGTAALFSCKAGERAFETPKLGKGHGVFFHHVIRGLKGEARNRRGEVTWSSLSDYVTDKVSDEVPKLIGGGARQTPHEIKNLTGKSPVLTFSDDALFQQAMDHALARGVPKNNEESVRCLRQSAERGHSLSLAALAWFHSPGMGVPRDREEGAKLALKAMPGLRKQAEAGDADAQVLLGWMYRLGLGVAQDFRESFAWTQKAADQGHPLAWHNLGSAYGAGLGVERDDRKAVEWFRKAADKDFCWSFYDLGLLTLRGQGVKKDDAEAARWFLKAAKRNHEWAQSILAGFYLRGQGVTRDEKQGVEWYRQAAENGDFFAQNALGSMYARGHLVRKDLAEAAKWYRRAAERNEAPGQFNLGRAYALGEGVPRDSKQALFWLRKAARQGNKEALSWIGKLEKE